MKKTSIITILLGILVLGGMLLFAKQTSDTKTELLDNQALSLVERSNTVATNALQARLEDGVSALNAVSSMLATKEAALWFSAESVQEAITTLKGYGFAEAALCDMKGNAYDSMGGSFSVGDCKYYIRASLGDTVISYQSFHEEADPALTVVFHAPVYEKGAASPTGVLRAAWNTDVLRTTLSDSAFRGKEDVLLINRSAQTVLSLSGNFTENTILSLYGSKGDNYLNMEQVIKQGRENIEFVTDKEGTENIICYKGIRKVNDWGVATVIETTEIEPFLSHSYRNTSDFIPLYVALGSALILVGLLLFQAKKRYALERMANVDHITKSYNFKGFAKRMNKAFEKDPNSKYAFLEVTLDRFDYFKETFGNEETNKTLAFMSSIIEKFVHKDEAFCRYNTMYFILLLKYQSEEELKNRILYLIDKIGDDNGHERNYAKFSFDLKVGVYCLPQIDSNVDELIRCANTALMAAQSNHFAPYEFYKSTMETSKAESKEFEEHMYDALEEREFLVYLQPKFSLKDGRQTGAEALVRWMHPEKGLLFPGRFISLFEKNGFIIELDMYILDELCSRLRKWIRKGIKPMPLSINISMHNLYNENFVRRVKEIVHKHGIPANLIMLEFSEESIAGNIELTQEIVETLKEEGFLISMDDFGKSATSMNTLYQTRVDELKIDRKFLTENEKTERGQSIINTVMETSKKLGINVVGEGVNDKSQAKLLRDLGCDMMQGFVFAEPLPEHEYEEYAYGARASENKISI
ncbi:MAG: GGDEF domain-containing protein [Lachnospiraceae bacterium]|nr:GGDEF domain-containing protein [Lachnospiraceae bacterium]